MDKVCIGSLDLSGQRVLVRVDFNVPLQENADRTFNVTDDTRIRAALPTLEAIVSAGGRAILLSHLGRPRGTRDSKLSLAPVAEHLRGLIETPVTFLPFCVGTQVREAVDNLLPGCILLLENTRFESGETNNDSVLAAAWAELAEVYVNDAFGTAHRAHASTEGVAHFV